MGRHISLLTKFLAWLALLLAAGTVHAAWWEFGKSENEPVVTELKLNRVDVMRVDDRVTLNRDDLGAGAITVRGRAEIGTGQIGLVEVSLDAGRAWSPALLGDRGLFAFEFRPDPDREYDFRVRAITTTGVSTDVEDHAFKIVVRTVSNVEEVRAAFGRMLDAYHTENQSAFMRNVSRDFQGNISALEDAIRNDFRFLENIRIDTQVSRVAELGQDYEIYFTFNRQVQSSRSGRVIRDNSASAAMFRREGEGYKLVRLSAPLIFGVSDTEEVATGVTQQAVGTAVLVVSASTGAVSTAKQATTTVSSATESGTFSLTASSLTNYQGFTFAANDRTTETSASTIFGDIAFPGPHLSLNAGVRHRVLGTVGVAGVTEAPASGYTSTAIPRAALTTGNTFALELPGPKYAVIEVVSIGMAMHPVTLTLKFKFQPSGSRSF